MKNEEIKKLTKDDLLKLKDYIETIDPKNKVFNETKKIIEISKDYNDNKNIKEFDKLFKNNNSSK